MDSLKFHLGPPCGWATAEIALRPFQGGRPVTVFHPLGHPTPYTYAGFYAVVKSGRKNSFRMAQHNMQHNLFWPRLSRRLAGETDHHGGMARAAHGPLKVLSGLAMPYPCGWATPERPAANFYPFGHTTPYAYDHRHRNASQSGNRI
jgi:hypothetical protein